jgi:hypothetical protein
MMLAAVAEPGWPVGYTTKSAVQLAVVRLGPYLAGEALGCTVAVAPPPKVPVPVYAEKPDAVTV